MSLRQHVINTEWLTEFILLSELRLLTSRWCQDVYYFELQHNRCVRSLCIEHLGHPSCRWGEVSVLPGAPWKRYWRWLCPCCWASELKYVLHLLIIVLFHFHLSSALLLFPDWGIIMRLQMLTCGFEICVFVCTDVIVY